MEENHKQPNTYLFMSKTDENLLQEKIARAGISPQLASFLLFALSPFNPNPDILENKDLLAQLTKQVELTLPGAYTGRGGGGGG